MRHLYPHLLLSPDGDGGTGTPPAGANPPAGDSTKPDAAKELEAARAELAQLKTAKEEADAIWAHTQKVLAQGSSPESAESLRVLLKKAGYSTGEIEGIVNPQESDPALRPTGGVDGRSRKGPKEEGEGAEDERDLYVKQLEARLKAVEGDTNNRKRQDLEAKLDAEIEAVLASDPDMKVMLEKAKDPATARSYLMEEIRNHAKADLRRYSDATGGRLDIGKFGQYAKASAVTVGKKLRSVIGNPQHLGRSPETDSGVSEFLQSKPVVLSKTPTGGDGRGEVTSFINDQLTRALVGNSEESRL